jgi:hypothetical protein
MKLIINYLLKNMIIIILCTFCNLAVADKIQVNSAHEYPYKDLINRAKLVNVFYIKNDDEISCRVEVVLDKIKLTTVEMKINKVLYMNDVLSNCLSKETAKEMLLQTFLQFGRGL